MRESISLNQIYGELPDPVGARTFFERLENLHPQAANKAKKDPALLSDVLAIASWSPLLASTLLQNPDYITWLGRERTSDRVKSREDLAESLARFSLTNSEISPQILLARFRRRELLRIYLRDIRNRSTVVEATEEISVLADSILGRALTIAAQEMDN